MSAGNKGEFHLDDKDDAVRMSTVLLDGDLKWPPPPLPAPPPPPPKPEAPPEETGPPDLYKPTFNNAMVTTGGIAGIIGMGFVSPSAPPTFSPCASPGPSALKRRCATSVSHLHGR